MCGTKSSTSMRKESREANSVKMLRMKIPRRYRGECDGAWKWADAAMTSMMSVNRAAMGCTIRIVERVVRVSF